MRRLVVSLLLLLAPAAAAQDFPPVDPQAPPASAEATDGLLLLEGRDAHDPALAGTTRFGIYLGTSNIGDFTLTVAPVSSGGAYQATGRIDVRVPKPSVRVEDVVLDAKFGVVSRTTSESSDEGEKTTAVRREGAEWVQETTEGGQTETARLAAGALDHGDMAAMILLVRAVDLSRAGEHRLSGVMWGGAPRYRDVLVSIPAARTTREHRGQQVEVVDVRIDQGDRESMTFSVTPAHELVAMTFQGAPVSMVAGTAEEVAADLPAGPAKPPVAGTAATPLDAVRTYFRVAAKLEPTDALDAVMDWAKIRDQMKSVPGAEMLGGMAPEGVAQVLKQGMEQSPASFGEDELQMIMMMMTTTEEGETARVDMPQAASPFVLERTEGTWRITGLPH